MWHIGRQDGTVIVRRAPESHPEPTPARKASQSGFAQALLYMRCLKAQPEEPGNESFGRREQFQVDLRASEA